MGKKRPGDRKRFYVYLGFLITLLCSCATITNFENRYTAREHLRRSEQFLAQENFAQALQESEAALALSSDEPPGDIALFMMGLIFAHHNNPARSYKKASGFFEQAMAEYPASPIAKQAEIWATILNEVEKKNDPATGLTPTQKSAIQETPARKHLRLGQELLARKDFDRALEEYQRALALSPRRSPGDSALFDMGIIFASSDNPNRDFNASLEFFRILIDEFPQSILIDQARVWVDVLKAIEKSKQVDIEIEKKKKELTR